jgi:hypothetical protein
MFRKNISPPSSWSIKQIKIVAWKKLVGRDCLSIARNHCPFNDSLHDVSSSDYRVSKYRMIDRWEIWEHRKTPTCSISQSSMKCSYSTRSKLFITFRDTDKRSYRDKNKVIKERKFLRKQSALYRRGKTEVLQYSCEWKPFECSAANLRRLVVKRNSRFQCNFQITESIRIST